jgi:hypothetical protein
VTWSWIDQPEQGFERGGLEPEVVGELGEVDGHGANVIRG